MKRIFVTVFTALFLLSGPLGAQLTILDEHAEVRQTGAFSAISVSGNFEVFLSQGAETAVVVSASEVQYRNLISTEVRNGTLYIGLRKANFNIRGSHHFRAYISVPALQKIELSGLSKLTVDKVFKADVLEVHLSGSSDFEGQVQCAGLKLFSSGSSDFELSGSAASLSLNTSGSSDLKAFGLAAGEVDIISSGNSKAQITVNGNMRINMSGGTVIQYKGSGVVKEFATSGNSKLVKVD